MAQQHRRTRQAVNPKHSSSALVYGECTPVCSVDCIGVNKQCHKAAVSWLAQQHRRPRQAGNPKHCSSALVYGECKSVCSVDCIGVNKQWHKAAVSWFGTAAQKTKAGR